jgi:hypothetical protein
MKTNSKGFLQVVSLCLIIGGVSSALYPAATAPTSNTAWFVYGGWLALATALLLNIVIATRTR